MKIEERQKKKLIGIYLPIFLIRELKFRAATKMTTVSAVVESAIKKFLEEE
jgi:hypothetical protein